jgi:hypothetical protein
MTKQQKERLVWSVFWVVAPAAFTLLGAGIWQSYGRMAGQVYASVVVMFAIAYAMLAVFDKWLKS